jgi:DNA-binding transcriptional ArsR family regulator
LATRRPPSLTNPRLATALSHPTRLRAMRVISERVATPREIAAEIDEPINNVAYHIKVLKKLECIELVQVKQARGGRVAEHFYKATQRPYWDPAAWEKLDEADRLDVTSAIMQQISEDIAIAMSNGTFNDPDSNHISRSPMVVDKDGWGEIVALLKETMEGLMAIQGRVDERRGDTEEALHTKIEIIQFRSPAPRAPETD